MSSFATAPDGRRWVDGFKVGDRVTFYDKPGTITSYHPESETIDECGEQEPEFWCVTLDEGGVGSGYINEFDFIT